MAQYIDKDVLVAEIERKRDICNKVVLDLRSQENKDYYQGKAEAYQDALSLIDTLEVREVDLEKEMDKYFGVYRDENGKTHDIEDGDRCFDWKEDSTCEWDMRLAKHFYELGIKTQKGKYV